MRETQMKKIIAAAVASAFIAPAMAADISISGGMAFILNNSDNTAANLRNDDGNTLVITAVDELDNGMTIEGNYAFEDDSGVIANDGSNIVLSGPFGTLGLGDNSGAADSVGDYSDRLATGMGHLDGDDHAILYTLPIEQVEINLSHSPAGATAVAGGSIQDDVTGVSAEATFGPVSVAVAYEKDTSLDQEQTHTQYGLRYSANGFVIGYDYSAEEAVLLEGGETVFSGNDDATEGGGDVEHAGLGISYTMGAITVAAENQKVDQGSIKLADTTGISVAYAMGPATFMVMTSDDDVSDDATTRVGVRYGF
jgi:hypothetical protein